MTLEHTSHSAVEEYLKCPHRFYLRRIERVSTENLLAGPAGSAFHSMTEDYDNGNEPLPYESYLQDQLEDDTAYVAIRTEDYDWWVARGDDMFDSYVKWRNLTGWDVLGVEEEFSVQPEGLSLPFVGFIDRRFRMSTGHVVVVDIKTGYRMPKMRTQLNEYAAASRIDGNQVDAVTFYDARWGSSDGLTWPIDWDANKLVEHVAPVEQAILAEKFDPQPDANKCRYCPVRQHCEYKKGSSK